MDNLMQNVFFSGINIFSRSLIPQKMLDARLLMATDEEDLEGIKNALYIGADVNAKNRRGETPLHFVEDINIARLLLENGADVNAKKRTGETPLYFATDINIAKLLLENGADVNAKKRTGETPLHYEDDINIAKLLLENGADVNAENIDGLTPLHYEDDISIAKLLIDHGAETINVNHRNPEIQDLITQKATELTNNLTALKALPDDINQLTQTQKALVTHLTAPKKAGNPLEPRAVLGDKSLVDYMREEKPQLLFFAEGYHKDKIFGGAGKATYTGIQELTRIFTTLKTNPEVIENPEGIADGTFKNKNPIRNAGIEFRAVTKIQALGRGGIVRQNNMMTTSRIEI